MARNGELDTSTLVEIRPGLRLKANAAWWFNKMSADFQKHFGYPIGVTDAYRTLASQVRLKKEKGPFAAKPGTSNHGWGMALDLATRINSFTSAEHKWMAEHGHEYGWTNPYWARDNNPSNGQQEPWHWEHDDRPIPAQGAAKPVAEKENEDMPWILACGVQGHKHFGVGWIVTPQGTGNPRASTYFGGASGLKEVTITDPRTWAGFEKSIWFN